MADGLSDSPQIVRASDEHAAESALPSAVGIARRRAARREASPHSHKFRAVFGTLVGIAIGAVVVAVAVVSHHTTTTHAAPWSSWQPPDNGTLGARDIAGYIAPLYRISPVDQLDVITVVNLADSTAAATAAANGTATNGLQVAVQFDPSSAQVSLLSGNTIAYNLCGVGGKNCAIGIGQASTNRLLLLRREGLELALYTLKYISGVQNVVTILPPGHTEQTSTLTATPPAPNAKSTVQPVDIALLFSREELKPWLSLPVRDTLPLEFPPSVPQLTAWRKTAEAGLVDQITAHGLFSERLVTAQDGSNLIVLDPLPPQ